jgi:hypothetical protein
MLITDFNQMINIITPFNFSPSDVVTFYDEDEKPEIDVVIPKILLMQDTIASFGERQLPLKNWVFVGIIYT